MNLRTSLKLGNSLFWAVALIVVVSDEKAGPALVPLLLAAGCALHFGADALVALRRLRRRAAVRDLTEYAANRPTDLYTLSNSFADDDRAAGIELPVAAEGRVAGPAPEKAPLSGKPCLAWALELELISGVRLLPGDEPALAAAAWWGDVRLSDGSRQVPLAGPGLIDPAGLTERVMSWKDVLDLLPQAGRLVAAWADLPDKARAKARYLVRELRLAPDERVVVFGQARVGPKGLEIGGSDEPDDPGSLLVRAAARPASGRVSPQRIRDGLTLVAGIVTVAAALLFLGLRLAGVQREGPIHVDTDGREIHLVVGKDDWNFEQGDTRTGVELQDNEVAVSFKGDAEVLVERWLVRGKDLVPGDPGYPAWDGVDWVFEPEAVTAEAQKPAGQPGPMAVRNLSDQRVVIRLLDPAGSARGGWEWTFIARAWAGNPTGSTIVIDNKPWEVRPDDRLELTSSQGFRRILPLSGTARFDQGTWRLDILPNMLAGTGPLRVRNPHAQTLRVWLFDSAGGTPFGRNPWTFDPKEGSTSNKGLALQLDSENIQFSGRETVRYGWVSPKTLLKDRLDRVAAWKDGHWAIELRQAGE